MSKVIKVTPTWEAVAPIISMVLQNENAGFDAIKNAEKELFKMARLADSWVDHVKETESGNNGL